MLTQLLELPIGERATAPGLQLPQLPLCGEQLTLLLHYLILCLTALLCKGSTQPAIRAAFGGKQLRRPGRRDEGSDSSEEREESEEDGNSEEMDDFIVKDDGVEASESEEEEAEESDDSEEEAKAPKKRGRK